MDGHANSQEDYPKPLVEARTKRGDSWAYFRYFGDGKGTLSFLESDAWRTHDCEVKGSGSGALWFVPGWEEAALAVLWQSPEGFTCSIRTPAEAQAQWDRVRRLAGYEQVARQCGVDASDLEGCEEVRSALLSGRLSPSRSSPVRILSGRWADLESAGHEVADDSCNDVLSSGAPP